MFRDRVLDHYAAKGYKLREKTQVRGRSGAVHACDLVAQGPLGNLVVQFDEYGGFEGPELEAVRRAARDIGATAVVAAPQVSGTVRRFAAQTGVVVLDDDALAAPPVPEPVLTAPSRAPDYPPWPDPERPKQNAGRSRSSPEQGEAVDADGPRHDKPRPTDEPLWPAHSVAHPTLPARMDPGEVDDLLAEWSAKPEPAPTRRQDPGFWKYGRDGDAPPATEAPSRPDAANGFSWLGVQQTTQERPEVVQRVDAVLERRPPRPVERREAEVSEPAPRTVEARRGPMLRWVVAAAVGGLAAGAGFFGLGLLFGVF